MSLVYISWDCVRGKGSVLRPPMCLLCTFRCFVRFRYPFSEIDLSLAAPWLVMLVRASLALGAANSSRYVVASKLAPLLHSFRSTILRFL